MVFLFNICNFNWALDMYCIWVSSGFGTTSQISQGPGKGNHPKVGSCQEYNYNDFPIDYVSIEYFIIGWWFQTFFIFHNIWDNPSHWLIFFRGVDTTNRYNVIIPYTPPQKNQAVQPCVWVDMGGKSNVDPRWVHMVQMEVSIPCR